MKQITTKYDKRESELATTCDRVIANMNNNADFPDAPPALAALIKMLPEFTEARTNAKGRDIKMVSIKNDKKAIVLSLLQQLADYVAEKSKGDRTLILSSGFDVTSDRPRGSKPAPSIEKLDVDLGPSGEVTIRIKNVTGIKAYIHQYANEQPGVNTIWTGEPSSEGSHTFTGLTSEKRYWFRVIAIGFNKQKAYSPVVSRVIQ